ncbi:DUF6268 family outer membrane beta-barrel protein [Maribacter sp. BPC-D8]|uniref:DUF6268 family outer membrane beta-barrel protein n=1 Tax=Maribacter sp. BPC-D8 TaxID=3053613 RepID=UPI002B45D276|nr:DUF6268 family outer membrane beta-barrel protein [Maribacter sp. BPC-D8]WRI30172.1 DUF6268 family outer membrane beta-barrel protein [Maribacter sp. BPC-D8]
MKKVSIFLMLVMVSWVYGQETDDIYIQSEFLPSSNVTDIFKLKAGLAIPLINTTTEKFTVGGKLENTTLSYIDDDVPFETDEIETFNSFSIRFTYQRNLSEDWSIFAMQESQISSNFRNDNIVSDDIFFNAMLTLSKYNGGDNSMLTFGAAYDIKYGLYYPIPVISYARRLNDNWAYKVGVPDSRVKYTLAENHDFEGFATLSGFTGNINDEVEVYKEDYSGTLRQTSVLVGLGYNVGLWDKFTATAQGGYTAYNRMQIKDYSNNEIYDFDMSNSFYFNVGVKYTFTNKTNDREVY